MSSEGGREAGWGWRGRREIRKWEGGRMGTKEGTRRDFEDAGCRIRIDRQTEGKAKKHNTMKERKKGKVGGK